MYDIKTVFTTFDQTTAEFSDNHIFLTMGLYILARIWVETTLFCIKCNGKGFCLNFVSHEKNFLYIILNTTTRI